MGREGTILESISRSRNPSARCDETSKLGWVWGIYDYLMLMALMVFKRD